MLTFSEPRFDFYIVFNIKAVLISSGENAEGCYPHFSHACEVLTKTMLAANRGHADGIRGSIPSKPDQAEILIIGGGGED